jgi:hypothetical protein
MARIEDHIETTLTAKDLKRIGVVGTWAPGSYIGKCRECNGEFVGDKRALHCLPCAIVGLKATIDGRDNFIVDRGLWQDFVDQLPR